MQHGKRTPLAEVEAALGRPCPHERNGTTVREDYCRKCSNNLANRQAFQRVMSSHLKVSQ